MREVRPGPTLQKQLEAWRRQYAKQLGRELGRNDSIICPGVPAEPGAIAWGRPMRPNTVNHRIGVIAKKAGLGHIAPHDLRRTAANILHATKTADGGHLYDLLDIQRVLDHADPATTMRSYLDHLDNAVKSQAGKTLD
jgi:integrase